LSGFERPEHPEHTEQAPARRPVRKSVPAPSYDQERAADSPADRRAQRYRAEMTLRQFAAERAARQAVQGEPASEPAPVSLPPTSTLARRLQERPGEATAATLMRQFEAERAAREAEADASPPPLPLRRRAPAADGATGPITPAEAPMATPQRQDEERGAHGEHAAEGVPPPRLPATGPAVAAPAPLASGRVERERDAAAHTLAEPAPHGADGGTPLPGGEGERATAAAAYPPASPSGLAPLVIPSTSRQIEALRARGGQLLDPRTARSMELALRLERGALDAIRIHADPAAWTLAQRLGAPAVLEGDDLFFQKGAYHPAGNSLLTYHLRRWAARRAPSRSDALSADPSPAALSPAALSVAHAPRVPAAAAAAGAPVGGADAWIEGEWQALADEPTYRLFAALLGYDPLAQRALARPADEALAAALVQVAPGAPPVNLATLRANGGLAQFVATLTREALAPGVPALREELARDVAAFLADPTGWLARVQQRHEAAPGLALEPGALPRQQAVEFFLLRVAPHLRALARAAADHAAMGAAYRASGMLSLRALGAVDHAAGARVLAVGQFDVGVVAVVQRGPSWWDLVVGGAVHTFEDAAGAVAAQALNALIGLGGPGAQQLARAAGADLGHILANPGAFFAHLTEAVGGGFTLFARDLGGNLERGALAWLSGQGGLTLPTLDAAGLLTFALETVGLSYASFTGDLETAFARHHRDGAKLVAGLDTLYQYAPDLHDLAAGGPGQLAALAGHLIGEVKALDVQTLVFDQVKAVLGPQLLLQVAPTLAGYLIPGADVAEAVAAVVRLVGTIVSRAAQLEAFAAAVLGAIDTLAGGDPHALTWAARAIEGALKEAAPLVLAFASTLVGVDVSHIGAAVLHKLHAQELVAALHKGLATLADAVADLLLKAVPPAVLARLEGHAAPEQTPSHAPAHPSPAHSGTTTPAQDKAHGDLDAVLAAAVTAVDARVAASPTTPLSEEEMRAVLTRVHAAHHEAEAYTLTPVAEGTHWAVRGTMVVPATPATTPTPPHHGHPHAGTQDVGTQDAATALDGAGPAARGDEVGLARPDAVWTVRAGTRTAAGEQELTRQRGTEALVKKIGDQEVPRTVIVATWDGTLPRKVEALPLTKAPPARVAVNGVTHIELGGSAPNQEPAGWADVKQFDDLSVHHGVAHAKYWRKLHLVSHRLHGPGLKWNLVPGRGTDNSLMERRVEAPVKRLVDEQPYQAFYYNVQVTYYTGDGVPNELTALKYFPKTIVVAYGLAYEETPGTWRKRPPLDTVPFKLDRPPTELRRKTMVDLSRPSYRDLKSIGMADGFARAVANEVMQSKRPFADIDDFHARMFAWFENSHDLSNPTYTFEDVYMPALQGAIDANKATFRDTDPDD